MLEKLRKIPHPGLRILKTALAATLCVVGYTIIDRPEGLPLACIAIFICVQDSVDKSWKAGKDRGLGTLLGGVLASLTGMLRLTEQHLLFLALAAFLGIVLYIFICNLLKISGSIVIGLATYIIILFGPQAGYVEPLTLAFNRTLDTLIGIVLGCLVNILLFRPRPERHRGHEATNPVFHYEVHEAGHHKTIKWDGGETKELYIYPEDTIYQEERFDFRVAVNVIGERHNSIRKFCGYKRQSILLDGEISLCHTNQHNITLGPYEQDTSLGAWESSCKGHGTELSLLTREGFSGKLELLYDGEQSKQKNGDFVSFYCLKDGVKLTFKNEGSLYKEELACEDYVIVSWFENGEESYTIELKHEEERDAPLVLMISCKREAADEIG